MSWVFKSMLNAELVLCLSSVIGTPREESWPQQTRIDLSLFVVVDPQPWTKLLKKECGLSAHDLLSVSTCN